MSNDITLVSYDDWKHCITVKCGINLTMNFLNNRLEELQNKKHPKTIQFAKCYGDEHVKTIINHLERAIQDLHN